MTTGSRIAPRGPDLPSFVPTFYPIVIAVAYLALLVIGLGVSVQSVTRVFFIAAFGIAALSVVINLVMRDRNRGGVACLVLVLLALFGQDPRVVAVVSMVAALVIAERVISFRRATRVPWRTITLVGNAVAVILVVTAVMSGLQNGAWGRALEELTVHRSEASPLPEDAADMPDVHVILLDAYERPNKMPELFGFDNGTFTSGLEERGFRVASASRSNYLLTALSMPSLLNMRHIGDLFEAKANYDGPYRALVRSFTADNAVFEQMHRLGYETVSIASGYEEVRVRDADRVIDPGPLNEYEIAMARTTGFGRWVNAVAPSLLADAQRKRVLDTLDLAAQQAERPHQRPLFTFVHLPSPHGPVVFGAEGQPLNGPGLDKFFSGDAHELGLTRAEFGRLYVGQVAFLNGRVIDAVDRILAASAKPPVIILMSDHGSGSGLNWQDLAHSDLDERTANLLATYTPGHPDVFPDNITLVNVFGTFLGAYFGIDVPRQPDTIYRWDDGLTHLIPISPNLAAP